MVINIDLYQEVALKSGYELTNKAPAIIKALEHNKEKYGESYCPCRYPRNEDTICPCKPFRESGDCVCGLYKEQELPTVEIIDITSNSLDKIAQIAGACYQKQLTTDVAKKIIDSGHISLLEHCFVTLRLRISTAVLAQITRHRHFSFTVQSSRGSRLIDYIIPENVKDKEKFEESMQRQMGEYQDAILRGEALEDCAYLLPKGAVVEVYISCNLRALYEYLPKRLCHRANAEHRRVALKIANLFDMVEPVVNKGMNCATCSEQFGCSFK